MPRRPKLTAAPDVMTTPSLPLLALVVKESRRLSYEALGRLLGCSEHAATMLCRGDEKVASLLTPQIIAAACEDLKVKDAIDLVNWAATPPHGRRGLPITDAIQKVFNHDNELTKLHRQWVSDGNTTAAFAAKVGVSRQRLWVLEQAGRGRGYDRAVEKARGSQHAK